jgi:alanyl-tRNA synthetase
MKREFLEKLGISKELIDQIVAEHGKGVETAKAAATTAATEAESLKAQLAQRDKDIAELKKGAEGNEGLKKQFDDLQAKHKEETEALTKQVEEARLTAAIKLAVATTAHDPDILAAQIDRTKITLNADGTVKMGLDEQVKALKTGKPFLFKDDAGGGGKGKPKSGEPGPSGDDPPKAGEPSEAELNAVFGLTQEG